MSKKPDVQKICINTTEMLVKNLQSCKTYHFLTLTRNAVTVKLVIPFGEEADLYVQILNILINDKERELMSNGIEKSQTKYWPSFGQQAGTRIIKVKNQ